MPHNAIHSALQLLPLSYTSFFEIVCTHAHIRHVTDNHVFAMHLATHKVVIHSILVVNRLLMSLLSLCVTGVQSREVKHKQTTTYSGFLHLCNSKALQP